jgi:hypothetical protein
LAIGVDVSRSLRSQPFQSGNGDAKTIADFFRQVAQREFLSAIR